MIKKILQKETFKNIGYVSIGKLGSVVLGLTTISFMARGLGPHNFGLLTLFLTLIELVNLLALPGFNSILQKSLHHKNYIFYTNAYFFTFISSLISGFILFIVFNKIEYFKNLCSSQTIQLLSFASLFVIIRTIDKSEAILPPLKKFKALALFNFLSSLAKFIGLGLTSIFYGDLLLSIQCYLICQVCLSLFSFFFSLNILGQEKKNKNEKKSTLKQHNFVKESLQMSLLNFFNMGIGQLDKILLYHLSATTLGIYQAGASYPDKLREVIKTFIMAVTNSWLSYGDEEFKVRAIKFYLFLILGPIIGSVILYFSSYLYIPLLLGHSFEKSIPIAGLMGIIIFIKLINYFFQNRDLVFGPLKRYQFKIILYRTVYASTLFLLIKPFGIYGIIIAIFISEITYLSMLLYDFFKKRHQPRSDP